MQIQHHLFLWKKPQIQGKPPQPRYGHSAILYENYMIIFGGEHNDIFETLNDIHSPRFGHSTIQFNSQMIIYGGLWIDTEAGNHSYDNRVYILETDELIGK